MIAQGPQLCKLTFLLSPGFECAGKTLGRRELCAAWLCTFSLVTSGGVAVELAVEVRLGLLGPGGMGLCPSLNVLHDRGLTFLTLLSVVSLTGVCFSTFSLC